MLRDRRWRAELGLDTPTSNSLLLRKELTSAAELAPQNTALLLSGRIDSSALAALNPHMPVYTAGLAGAPDLKYARKVAEVSGIKEKEIIQLAWEKEEAMAILNETVKFMRSYDLAVLSDMIVYACMKKAAEAGITAIRTGDMADELFEISGNDVDSVLERQKRIGLQSEKIASGLGLAVDYPYLNEGVVDVARRLSSEENVTILENNVPSDLYEYDKRKRADIRGSSYTWSKVTLRRAMYGVLSNDVVYRMKAPLQYGGFTYKLTEVLEKIPTKKQILKFESDGKRFWPDMRYAHAGLYILYRMAGLEPRPVEYSRNEYPCRWCSGAVEKQIDICFTCGGWPPNSKPY